uniref:ABC transporter permease n=1 Tax=candidate division WOR-3 bacterium TaxID=2052148 RepID=A0A7C6A877_UNCW3
MCFKHLGQGIVQYWLFIAHSLFIPWQLRKTFKRLVDQIFEIGIGALPMVLVMAIFVGLTTAIQTAYQTLGIVPKYFLGIAIGRMILIEFGPVFTAFVVAGKSASAMAAEIGTMRVTEQIDALAMMGINPYRYLCLPRILGALVALPLLVIFTEFIAIVTAILTSIYLLKVSYSDLTYGLIHHFRLNDLVGGLVKALFFAFLIATTGCFFGLQTTGGAKGVGQAVTRAVVTSLILIFAFDFINALLFFQ